MNTIFPLLLAADDATAGIRDVLASVSLAGGLFFMFVGAVGVVRFPDAYQRIHAASKCTTLGIAGMLFAAILHVWTLDIAGKAIMAIVFTLVASPIGSHLLAKAAHHCRIDQWPGTLSDELAQDKADPNCSVSDDEIGIPEGPPRLVSQGPASVRVGAA